MKVNSDALRARLSQGLNSIYLISGDDPLLTSESAELVRKKAYDCGFSGRDLHVAERGFDWAQVAIESSNLSLFDDKKITEIRIPTGKPGKVGSAALIEFAERIHSDECLLVMVPKLDKSAQNSAWVKKLSAIGVFVQVWPINAQQLPGWIAGRLKKSGLEASREAVLMLADRSQGNLLAAQQEIIKLGMNFDRGKIGAEDVAKSVADSARFDVFQLVDAALVGDTQRTLRILSGLRAEGVEPTLILWALAREVRTLVGIAHAVGHGESIETGLARAKVWSTRKALVSRAARRLKNEAHVIPLLELCAQTDAAIKGQSAHDPWSGLRALVVGISHGDPILSVA